MPTSFRSDIARERAAHVTHVMRAVAMVLVLVVIAPTRGSAQQTSRSEPPVCLGFSFGKWSPALDWKAAGHTVTVDPHSLQHAADGRDWATTQAVESDSIVVLLPSWWPAGVSVTLPNRAPAIGDTVVGSAFAYVADGRRAVPKTAVRAWRVPCASRADRRRLNRLGTNDIFAALPPCRRIGRIGAARASAALLPRGV